MTEPASPSLDELRRHFRFFDDDNNGFIDFEEYLDMIDILGLDDMAARANDHFAVIDTNGDGLISFPEFVAWWNALWGEAH